MNGKNLYNAAAVMSKAGEEIEAMLEALFDLIDKQLRRLDMIQKVEQKGDDLFDDSNNWVFPDLLRNFGIYKNRAKRPSAYLALQVKLCDKEEGEIVGPQPLLYVLFCSEDNWGLDEFLLHKAVKDGFRLEGGCLWRRYDDNEVQGISRLWWKDEEMAYVLPLISLNTQEDLRALIVDPICTLIKDGVEAVHFDGRIMRFQIQNKEVKLKI